MVSSICFSKLSCKLLTAAIPPCAQSVFVWSNAPLAIRAILSAPFLYCSFAVKYNKVDKPATPDPTIIIS